MQHQHHHQHQHMQQPNKNYKTVDKYYYDPETPLGKGTLGYVYRTYSRNTQDTRELVVKPIAISQLKIDSESKEKIIREVGILRQIKGEHIVELVDIKQTPNNLYLFMEYCDGGDLEMKLKKSGKLSEEEALSIVKQIAEAFVQLDLAEVYSSSGRKITLMHRELKPRNILFNQGKVKITDFGFAKVIDDVDQNIRADHTALEGTFYSCPQLLNYETYSAKCDVWSTGMILYNAIFGGTPWGSKNIGIVYDEIKNKPLLFPGVVKGETKDLIRGMLQMEEENRFSWKEVYEHPAFKNI